MELFIIYFSLLLSAICLITLFLFLCYKENFEDDNNEFVVITGSSEPFKLNYEIEFYEGGYYCIIPVADRLGKFAVFYPYTDKDSITITVATPISSIRTIEEVKLYQKTLINFIKLLENPPKYEERPHA